MLSGEQTTPNEIAKKLGVSSKSIHDHLTKHDEAVDRLSYCPLCRRAKGQFETVKAKRKT